LKNPKGVFFDALMLQFILYSNCQVFSACCIMRRMQIFFLLPAEVVQYWGYIWACHD